MHKLKSFYTLINSCVISFALIGCANLTHDEFTHYGDGPPVNPPDLSNVLDPTPVPEPLAKYGNKSYQVNGVRYQVMESAVGYEAVGHASWYGMKFQGRRTSSGEPYDIYKMTAAHKSLPLPTYVEVTNLENQKRIVVRVNDRGPFIDSREIDLSYAAAYKLGMLDNGTARVKVRVLQPSAPKSTTTATPAYTSVASRYLQVGIYNDVNNAHAMQRKLQSLMNLPIVISSEPDKNDQHRVVVGPFDNEAMLHRINGLLEFHGIIGLPTQLN